MTDLDLLRLMHIHNGIEAQIVTIQVMLRGNTFRMSEAERLALQEEEYELRQKRDEMNTALMDMRTGIARLMTSLPFRVVNGKVESPSPEFLAHRDALGLCHTIRHSIELGYYSGALFSVPAMEEKLRILAKKEQYK